MGFGNFMYSNKKTHQVLQKKNKESFSFAFAKNATKLEKPVNMSL